MDKLNLIELFIKVAQKGSFAATATHLGIDPSTVSKAISQLEAHLGWRLFTRTTRKLQLTDAGQVYRQQCLQLLEGLEQCEQALLDDQSSARGLLKINLPVAYGQLYIMPMIGRFCQRYPDIRLDISLTDDYVDVVEESIDVAVRSGQLQDSRLVARKLTPMDFATAVAPAFLQHHANFSIANIDKYSWVNYRFIHTGRTMPLYRLKGRGRCKQPELIEPRLALTTTDGLSMIRAGIEGVGLVQAPHFLLRDAVIKGELNLVQSYFRYEQFNVYAYYPHKQFLPQKVKVFLEFVVQELAQMGENHNSTFLSSLTEPVTISE